MSHHIHKYKKINIGVQRDYFVMKCMDPTCTHYIPVALAQGRQCVCWRCLEVFTLTVATLQYVKPHCVNCVRQYTRKEEVAV